MREELALQGINFMVRRYFGALLGDGEDPETFKLSLFSGGHNIYTWQVRARGAWESACVSDFYTLGKKSPEGHILCLHSPLLPLDISSGIQ